MSVADSVFRDSSRMSIQNQHILHPRGQYYEKRNSQFTSDNNSYLVAIVLTITIVDIPGKVVLSTMSVCPQSYTNTQHTICQIIGLTKQIQHCAIQRSVHYRILLYSISLKTFHWFFLKIKAGSGVTVGDH